LKTVQYDGQRTMGEASETIFRNSILYFLAVEKGVLVAGTMSVPDNFSIPDDFDFKQAPPKFQQKVLRKMLENFIREFEETEDLLLLSDDSLRDIKDGLNKVGNGFYTLKENDSQLKEVKIELKEVKKDIDAVHPLLRDALAFVYAALSEFEDNGDKKTHDYFLSLLNCRDKMSEIKLQLRAWQMPKGTT